MVAIFRDRLGGVRDVGLVPIARTGRRTSTSRLDFLVEGREALLHLGMRGEEALPARRVLVAFREPPQELPSAAGEYPAASAIARPSRSDSISSPRPKPAITRSEVTLTSLPHSSGFFVMLSRRRVWIILFF